MSSPLFNRSILLLSLSSLIISYPFLSSLDLDPYIPILCCNNHQLQYCYLAITVGITDDDNDDVDDVDEEDEEGEGEDDEREGSNDDDETRCGCAFTMGGMDILDHGCNIGMQIEYQQERRGDSNSTRNGGRDGGGGRKRRERERNN